jgi:hypothetical protein
MATVGELIERAREAYDGLVAVGEAVDDEWQYITDLSAAWRAELDRLAVERGSVPGAPGSEAAVDWLVAEIARIADPHQAIDWLSTFPQAVLLAVAPPASAPDPAA